MDEPKLTEGVSDEERFSVLMAGSIQGEAIVALGKRLQATIKQKGMTEGDILAQIVWVLHDAFVMGLSVSRGVVESKIQAMLKSHRP